MVPEEWPIAAAPEGDNGEPERGAGGPRLPVVRRDFSLPEEGRLSDQERALMTSMLADLVGGIETELAAALPAGTAGANDADGLALVGQLRSAGLLDSEALVRILLRRAEEERVAAASRHVPDSVPAYLQALISDNDDPIAASAMALVIARGRRRDRLGLPRILFEDCDAGLADDLLFGVAAAMRVRWPDLASVDDADSLLDQAARTMMAATESGRSLDRVAATLVQALASADRLDDGLLCQVADCGDLLILVHALAARSGLPLVVASDAILGEYRDGFVLLLKAAGVDRDPAVRILAGIGAWLGVHDPVAAARALDRLEPETVAAFAARGRFATSYRRALAALRGQDG